MARRSFGVIVFTNIVLRWSRFFIGPSPGFKTLHFQCSTFPKKSKRWYYGFMEKGMRRGSHTVSRLRGHIVWVTKYRYHVLEGDIKKRCRELIIQVCEGEEVQILKGVVSKDHIHIHIEYPPRVSISHLVKRMKGRSSRIL